MMRDKTLIVCPAFNEERTVGSVIQKTLTVLEESGLSEVCDMLVIDDGSSDETAKIVASFNIKLLVHHENYGYGYTLREAFAYASHHHYKYAITIDTDGQHDPSLLPRFVKYSDDYDIVSGSRYLPLSPRLSIPPAKHINKFFTDLVNDLTSYRITDVGCGMKRIFIPIIKRLNLMESGYGFPLEFWLLCDEQLASVIEIPVPLIYVDPTRHFGTKFPSMSVGVDYCIFVIMRTLLTPHDNNISYQANYPQFFAKIMLNVNSSVKNKVGMIYRNLKKACRMGFPGALALKKIGEMKRKWEGFYS